MAPNEIIRPLTREELGSKEYLEFAAALFGPKQLGNRLRYWKWLYAENPCTGGGDPLPVYCYWSNDRPVGQLGIIPTEIILDGKRQKAGWCIDFYILKEFQRRGIGGKLLEAVYQKFALLMTLGQTDASKALFLKEGWYFTTPMVCHRKFLNPGRAIIKKILTKMAPHNTARPQHSAPVHLPNIIEEEIELFLGKLNSLSTNNLRQNRRVGVSRDKEYLVWRYVKNPFLSYEGQLITAAPNIFAYVIWRFSQRGLFYSGIVQEILYSPNLDSSNCRRILDCLAMMARNRGAEVLECQTSDPLIANSWPRGLVSRDSGARFLYGSQRMNDCPYLDSNEWKLFAGDCDVDLINCWKANEPEKHS